jgi:hypothetical protein
MTDTTQLHPILTHYLAWFKAHEKLVFVGIGAFLLFHFYGAGLKAWEAHDQRVSTQAAQQVQTDHTTNQQTQAELTQLIQVVSQQQVSLDKLMSQRAIQVIQQKKTDAKMTPSELAGRFQKLLSVGPLDVTSAPITGNLVFTPPAAQADIAALEDLQQFKGDNANLRAELMSQESLFATQTNLLNGTEKELEDEKKSHAADVATLNIKIKRSWLRGFKVGVVAGAVGGELIRLFVFHKP